MGSNTARLGTRVPQHLTNYIARSLPVTGGFKQQLPPVRECADRIVEEARKLITPWRRLGCAMRKAVAPHGGVDGINQSAARGREAGSFSHRWGSTTVSY